MYEQIKKTNKDVSPTLGKQGVAKMSKHQNSSVITQQMVDNSSRVMAQNRLKQIIQGHDNTIHSIQRKAMGVLGSYSVDDSKYANGNSATILNHVAGEWDKSNTTKPKGGHILKAMTSTWGQAYANKANVRDATTNASGVYFTGSIPNAGKIVGDTFDYFIVDYSDTSNKKQSKTKTSSFWPVSWDISNLGNVLADSYKTNTADTYASKAEVTYWFTWNSLGDDTSYPLARYTKMI
jgi:Holliday junction resolvasome RuvABC endonuclease subunit